MRKVYLLPNFVTTGNLFCGFYSVIAAHHGDFIVAAWAIMAATVFDALDGRIARLARATSNFGVEYDSLCDLVSFGLAPAFLLYTWAFHPFGRAGWLVAFLFVVCGALRLARFNVSTDEAPKGFFEGLPIPGAAGTVASFVIFNFSTHFPNEIVGEKGAQVITLLLSLGLAALMVSTVRFPSFKELNWRSKASFGYLIVGLLAMTLIAIHPQVALFLVAITFILCSLLWNIYVLQRGRLPQRQVKSDVHLNAI